MTTHRSQSYAAAGVDIDAANRAKSLIKAHARSTFGPQVLSEIGHFGGLFQLSGYKNPVLVSSTDGVGTKLKIAIAMDRHNTVGSDLVNHCVNDILVLGAHPLFFLDYIAVGKMVPDQVEALVSGLAAACREAGCALIGGETAEMPGMYAAGDYDLAGFIVGAVEKPAIIDGSRISAGDTLIGLPSSGLHTNGYSLVRKLFLDTQQPAKALARSYPELGRSLGDELLQVHRCYYPMLKPVLAKVKGLAHITGGGLWENVPRILPQGLCARFKSGSWRVLPIFSLIQKTGDIPDEEMYRVFNMGVGMVVVCAPEHASGLLQALPGSSIIGQVMPQTGNARVIIE